ncbi:MAG: hypothetical protein Q4A62_04190 [Eikenella sp.]|nr:hypothetical protein [Eikenella sp.]
MNTAARVCLILLSLAYPALWYYGRAHGWFFWLAGLMALLWGLRALTQPERGQRAVSALVAVFFLTVLLWQRQESMYWYPVWVNALMLLLFGGSLLHGRPLVERLARLQTPDLPPQAVAYTRRVTQIWCAFFLLNGGTAAALALTERHSWWALYTGIVSYLLMGLLMGGEYAYRKLVLKV